ncbi:MAG: hypothetical protein HS113_28475 [Verrucomicrobiales bacterium]|nr:hypothetical protein [Verrucomicrobiales bacterium]
MRLALQVINGLEREGLIRRPAIGGAMALLFHDEPVVTFDLDVFCLLPQSGLLVSLEPVYGSLRARGYQAEAEAVVIGGVPVQFIPAYNELVTEAVEQAEERSFDGVPARVLTVEHLLAIMVQTNRPKDRERLASMAGRVAMDRDRLTAILSRHHLLSAWKALNFAC